MSQFQAAFLRWFLVLVGFLTFANLVGFIRPTGLKPIRFIGFPFTISAWGVGIEEFFDWSAFALNVMVAISLSGALAGFCAWSRTVTK